MVKVMSENKFRHLRELRREQDTYTPNPEVIEALRAKHFTAIIGPLVTGKTTVINDISRLDPEFGKVPIITTRPRLKNEANGYRFLHHSAKGIGEINAKRAAGILVQYAIDPSTSHVYASEIDDYQAPYSVQPIMSSTAVEQFRKTPFKSMTEVILTCDPKQWERRFMERFVITSLSEMRKRVKEGYQSLEWALDQQDVAWVPNNDLNSEQAARNIIDITRRQYEPEPYNRRQGIELFRHIGRVMTLDLGITP
jgi:guanylate kinase